ncbi:RAD55 family ATPase [Natronorubrum daqingense]|uniref:RecA-superfamily ATPase, KaiC/GvpD/RAD55 family n=2 Tax=Natronorubrum daqingense TaxID=588898 RepID=A0A1N7E969_9EURY|nr:RecA-superfamily ATPase, KaiC/GvpD/RAD55 family [Natronorubrum daqingense]
MNESQLTGLDVLDRLFNGGVPNGSIISLLTDPMTEGEILLRKLTVAETVLYISTVRTPEAVREWLTDAEALSTRPRSRTSASGSSTHQPESVSVTITFADFETPLSAVEQKIAALSAPTTIILDSINRLEDESEQEYLQFLTRVQSIVHDAGHVLYVHVLNDEQLEPTEITNREHTLNVSDSVWTLSSERTDAAIEHYLSIEKNRFGPVLSEPLELNFDGGVSVDTSRSITLS